MKSAWYIIMRSDELQEQLLACTVFDIALVLFRDEAGTAHALPNQCAHRGARLSEGKHRGNCLACPFHGWEFNGAGDCIYIPANGRDAAIPVHAKLTSYPLRECAGYIWIFLGNPQSVHELRVPPELNDPAWRAVPFTAHWKAHMTRVVESILDVSHLPFVHPTTTGDVDPIVDGPDFTVSADGICVHAKPFHPLLQTPLNEQDHKGESTITLQFPNQLILRTNMLEGHQMATYLSFTPSVDEQGAFHTMIQGLALRNFLTDVDMIDEIHYEHNVTVLEEDRPVVEGLQPQHVPLDLRAEVHVRSDAQQVRYRMMVKQALQAEEENR